MLRNQVVRVKLMKENEVHDEIKKMVIKGRRTKNQKTRKEKGKIKSNLGSRTRVNG